MSSAPSRHIVILGNGIAGTTAARHIRKRSEDRITLISAESPYFWSRTALMYIYMGHMEFHHTKPYEDFFWEKNRLELRQAYVQQVDFAHKTLHFADGNALAYDVLLLATGSVPAFYDWPGQDATGVQGLVSLQDLERMETHTRGIAHAVVVGGGLIGIEMAEMLRTRHIDVTFLVRESSFWDGVLPAEESDMVNRHLRTHGVDLRLGTGLREILADDQGHARAIVTTEGEEIATTFVGLTAGVRPQVDFLRGTALGIDRGILVDDYLRTNQPDVYALGDCAQLRTPQPGRRAIEAVWYTGRIMGETVAQTLTGAPTPYRPGIWFNSAKFFDIEYQVYGTVPPARAADEALDSLYWEDEKRARSVRIVFERDGQRVVGFHLMGIRYRQAVCEAWIAAGRDLPYVLEHLADAHFDAEFAAGHVRAVRARYPQQFPQAPPLRPAKRQWWQRVLPHK